MLFGYSISRIIVATEDKNDELQYVFLGTFIGFGFFEQFDEFGKDLRVY